MDDLDIIILNKELVDEDGSLDENLDLDEENTYLSLEIINIPRILGKMIIDRKMLNPKNDNDMEKINMIYFASLSDYKELLKFLMLCVKKLHICNELDITFSKYIQEFNMLSCELNLNIDKKIKKKTKIKKI